MEESRELTSAKKWLTGWALAGGVAVPKMLATSSSSWSRRVLLPAPLARLASTVARPPSLAALRTQDDMKLARAWISAFEKTSAEDWPKSACRGTP